MTLNELLEFVIEMTLPVAEKEQPLPAGFIFFDKVTIPVVFAGNYPVVAKEMTRRMFEWAARHGATGLAHFSEAWVVITPPGLSEAEKDAWSEKLQEYINSGASLEHHPDRGEIISIVVATPEGTAFRMWKLTRQGDKRILEPQDTPTTTAFRSRFFDTLEWGKSTSDDPVEDMKKFMRMWGMFVK